jgi:demethylmenaquinone methyltransferase/2-methoxy-6-polyprenyl-1,4-benzoquinol methylase
MDNKEYFNNAAQTWDKRFHTPELTSFLMKLVPQFDLKLGQNILDVGTGTGVMIPYLIRAVGPSGSVTAIDYSEKMIRICKVKYSDIKNVTIKIGDIEKNPFQEESFEAIICFGVFPHLCNKENALKNIYSMLKPYGKIAIAHAFSSEELNAHHKKISEQITRAMLPEKSKMIQLLEQTGFTQISIKDEPGCYLCTAQKS